MVAENKICAQFVFMISSSSHLVHVLAYGLLDIAGKISFHADLWSSKESHKTLFSSKTKKAAFATRGSRQQLLFGAGLA